MMRIVVTLLLGTASHSLGTARPSFGSRVSDTGTLTTADPIFPLATLLKLPLQAEQA